MTHFTSVHFVDEKLAHNMRACGRFYDSFNLVAAMCNLEEKNRERHVLARNVAHR